MSDAHEPESSSRLHNFLPDPDSLRRQLSDCGPSLDERMRLLQQRIQSTEEGVSLEELDGSYIEEGAEEVTGDDLDTVIEKADAIEDRFRENGPLRRLFDDGRLLLRLIRDARRGQYRNVPVWTLSAAAFTLLYVLNPMDAIPDAIPVLGVLDDAAVVSACLALLEQDLYEYKHWRRRQGGMNSASSVNKSREEGADETSR